MRSARTSAAREGAHRPASLPGTESLRYAAGTNLTNGILALEADGFRVSSNTSVQESNQPYHYIAFRNTGGGCSLAGTHTLSATADSWINQGSATSNNGSDSVLKVTSKSPNSNTRALVRFQSLLPTLPSGCTVTDATLRMRNKSPVSGRTLEAYAIAASWLESGSGSVTWNNAPATTGTGVAATGLTPSSAGFMTWSVGSLVQAGASNGFLIRDQTENDSGGKEQQFDSREASAADRPRLTVTLGG